MRMEFKFCSSSLTQWRRGWQPPTSGAARTPSVGCQTFSGQHFTSENNNEHLHGKDCARLNFCILFADHLCGAENESLWRWATSQSPTLLSISELWVLETLSSYSGHRALPVALSFKKQWLTAGDCRLPYSTPRPLSPNQSKSEQEFLSLRAGVSFSRRFSLQLSPPLVSSSFSSQTKSKINTHTLDFQKLRLNLKYKQ